MRIETCWFCSQPCYPSKDQEYASSATTQKYSTSVEVNAIRTYVSRFPVLQQDPLSLIISQFTMKRNPRKLRWTKAFRKAAGKELLVDKTLLFAARRNVPVRYNREHVATTLKAMKRVAEVRARRERVFYKNRMAGNKERARAANYKLVNESQHLLPRLRASEKMVEDVKEPMELVQKEELPVLNEEERKRRQLARNRQLVGGGEENGMDLD
ncbi:MAG: hypothetical protein LQ342_001168 [Letrouitia transgressa]|nr:MAG: hypothetical protein LQ342_001168 [Letrouitia transgressa]